MTTPIVATNAASESTIAFSGSTVVSSTASSTVMPTTSATAVLLSSSESSSLFSIGSTPVSVLPSSQPALPEIQSSIMVPITTLTANETATESSLSSLSSTIVQIASNSSPTNSTMLANTSPAPDEVNLAAAIAIPLVLAAVIAIAIVLILMIRKIRRQRATAGKYSPNRMEAMQQATMSNYFMKVPPPERLI